MATILINTHLVVRQLVSHGFTEKQAEGVTKVIEEIDLSSFPTKADVRAELAEFKADIFKWIVPLMLGQAALIAGLIKLLH